MHLIGLSVSAHVVKQRRSGWWRTPYFLDLVERRRWLRRLPVVADADLAADFLDLLLAMMIVVNRVDAVSLTVPICASNELIDNDKQKRVSDATLLGRAALTAFVLARGEGLKATVLAACSTQGSRGR